MSAGTIKAFGIFTFLFEAFVVLAVVGRWSHYDDLSFRGIVPVTVLLFAATLMGIGLVLLRKWAALPFSLVLIGLPIWNTVDTIGDAPLAWNLFVFVCAVVLMAPVVIIIRSWPLLSWRGKWFF